MFNSIPWNTQQTQQSNTNVFNTNSNSNSSNDMLLNTNSNLDFNGYLSKIGSLIQNQNGKILGRLLSFRQLSKQQILSPITEQQLSNMIADKLKNYKPWNVIIWHYLQSLIHSLNNNYLFAWKSSMKSVEFITDDVICSNKLTQNVWYLAVINTILKNASDCVISLYSNMEDMDEDKDNFVVDTFGKFMLIMREMTSDNILNDKNKNNNVNGTKPKLSDGLFFTVNQIIRVCDINNNQTYLNNVLNDVAKFKSIWTYFPLSDVVTHFYFKGRYNFQRGGQLLYEAKEDLENAYNLCLKTAHLNKIRILLLLIPIQIIFGYLPNLNKLDKGLKDRFFPIITALKTGNILLFKKAMNFYQDDFINCGIYLLLTKLEILIFRSLVCKVYVTKHKMNELPKPYNVNLSEIRKAIQIRNKQYHESPFKLIFDGNNNNNDKKENDEKDIDEILINEIDDDEIECILSTLIYKKLIGGYVAHNTVCVISKHYDKAFPQIKNCKDWWINDF